MTKDETQCAAVPLVELLRQIPVAQRLTWTEPDGLKATHFVPVGRYAHEAAAEIDRQQQVIADKEDDCVRLHKSFMDAKYPEMASPEPPAERQGVTFGCSKCSDTVTLLFTDATKKSIDIRPMNGWVAGPGGCFCPRCAPNRQAEPPAGQVFPALGSASIPFTHWSKDPMIPYTGCGCSSCQDMRRYRGDAPNR